MHQIELDEILEKHKRWLDKADGGERATLWNADLWNAIGNMLHIKSIAIDTYAITYTSEVIQIGCKRHDIEKWWAFTDSQIRAMDGRKSLDWWIKYKDFIKQAIELSPAVPTKTDEVSNA